MCSYQKRTINIFINMDRRAHYIFTQPWIRLSMLRKATELLWISKYRLLIINIVNVKDVNCFEQHRQTWSSPPNHSSNYKLTDCPWLRTLETLTRVSNFSNQTCAKTSYTIYIFISWCTGIHRFITHNISKFVRKKKFDIKIKL